MRIGIDVRSLSTQQRFQGVGYYTRNLLAALAALDCRNSYVLFGGAQDEATREACGRFHRAHYHQLFRPSSGGRLDEGWDQILSPLEVARYRLDLYFYPSLNNLAWWIPAPTVVMIHDMIPTLFSQDLLKTGIKHRLMYAIARRAARIVCPSESARADIARLLRIAPERIVATPEAADAAFVPASAAATARVRAHYGISAAYVLYVGDLAGHLHNKRKNLPLLVRAFAALPAELQATHQLVLAGKGGPYRAEVLDPLIDGLGLRERTIYTDFVPDADLPALYTGAATVAYPTRYEGFGLPVLQAMACGATVISTNVSSIPEVVGDVGILVPPDDEAAFSKALIELLSRPEEHQARGVRAQLRAASFSWQRTAEQTLEVFEQVGRQPVSASI